MEVEIYLFFGNIPLKNMKNIPPKNMKNIPLKNMKGDLPHFPSMCQLLDTAAALSVSLPSYHQSDMWVIIIFLFSFSFF